MTGYATGPDAPNPYTPDEGVIAQDGLGVPDALMRLWAPHRMAYHGELDAATDTPAGKPVCPFCRVPSLSDEDGLVVHRGEQVFAVLNLYPYNPGHLLVCPYRHVGDLTEASGPERDEMMAVAAQAMTAIRAAANPQGFNIGFNQGAVSGGSVNDHLHLHVVPRWQGDAGFMTVIGNTKSLPLLLGQTREMVASAWPQQDDARTSLP